MLGTFGTKKNKSVEVSKPTFQERLGGVKSMFKRAYEDGEDRVLRGFKIQFESRDGRYNCVDMDIEDNNNIRPVNINTIKWLIIGGTKYVVE